jgi:SpoU rRNA methylase family enzyme
MVRFMVFNDIFNNISVISPRSVLLVEETDKDDLLLFIAFVMGINE